MESRLNYQRVAGENDSAVKPDKRFIGAETSADADIPDSRFTSVFSVATAIIV